MARNLLNNLLTGIAVLPMLSGIAAAQDLKPSINELRTRISIDGQTLLDSIQDKVLRIQGYQYSPDKKHILVLACGYECNDNLGFLFNSDGSGKRSISSRWDFILQSAVEWSEDGRYIFYYRINSSGAETPKRPPRPGWTEVDLTTMRKSPARHRVLSEEKQYAVFNVAAGDALNLRSQPGRKGASIALISADATGIWVLGRAVQAEGSRWVRVRYKGKSGWVNQAYLRLADPLILQ
jgi:hypothetical protein